MAISKDIARIEYNKNGVALTEVKLDETRLEVEVAKLQRFTVVSQSVRAGATVPRGTVVDVTVATTSRLPIGVIANAPQRWQEMEIGRVAEVVRGNPRILKVLAEKESFDNLNDTERKEVMGFLHQSELPVDENELADGYGALRNAHLLAD